MRQDLPIPLEHAWLVNKNLEVVEVTWENNQGEYYGFVFNTQWLEKLTKSRKSEEYGVMSVDQANQFNYLDGIPKEALLTTKLK